MKNKKILSSILLSAIISSSFLATCVQAADITDVPRSIYSVEYEGQVQNIGWQAPITRTSDVSDIMNAPIAGTVGQGLRVEALKITGVNLPAGASITYQGQVQNIGWQAPVTTSGGTSISSATMAGTQNKGLRVEAFKMTLNGLPGYAVEYETQVQNIGWQKEVETVNGADISNATMAGTQNQGLRMEGLRIQIGKTIAEKDLEITAISAVEKAETSKSTTDITSATAAITLVQDPLEIKALNTRIAAIGNTTGTGTTTPVADPSLSALAYIDSPTDGQTIKSSKISVSGWALDPANVKEVEISVDGIGALMLSDTVSRPDVQAKYPQYYQENSGYAGTMDITNFMNGVHTLKVTVIGNDGKESVATKQINIQLPQSHENTALENAILSGNNEDFASGDGNWDFTALNAALDSISAQYLSGKISQAQAQQQMYAYSVNVPGHPDTRLSKVYFTNNTTSETNWMKVAPFVYSGGVYNKFRIWMNADGSNTITTIGADVTSN